MEEILVWKKCPSQIVNLGIFIQLAIVLLVWFILPHKIANFVIIQPIRISHILLLFCVVYFVYALIAILSVLSIRYELTEERLLVYSGILNQRRDELELYRVNDYKVVSPLYLRIFGMGTITIISTDLTTPILNLMAVKDVYQVADSIRANVEKIKIKKKILFVKS